MKILSSLPPIYKLEVEHPLFKDSGETQINTLNKIVKMLGVQFKDEKDRKEAGLEWVLFCQKYRLTAPEIVEAYTMALKKELKIYDEDKAYRSSEYEGEYIKVFPNLSLITAGEILKAYIEHKRIDKQWEKGKKIIDNYLLSPLEITSEQKKENDLKLWENLKKSVSENRPCIHASYFYEKLARKGCFKNFVGNEKAQIIVIRNKMHKIILSEYEKKHSLFSKTDLAHFKRFCTEDNYVIPETVNYSFQRLMGIAIAQVKNEMVYNYVKKQLKKKLDEARNSKSDSSLPEEPER